MAPRPKVSGEGAADETAKLVESIMKQLKESNAFRPAVAKIEEVASGAAGAVKDALKSVGQKLTELPANFKFLPKHEQSAIRRQMNQELQMARGEAATAEGKARSVANKKAKTNEVDKAINEVWSVETKKGYGRPALIRQIEGKQKIIDRSARITEDTAGALDFAVEKRVRQEITKFKEDGYILDKAEIKELVKDAWAFELNAATNGLRANTAGLSTRIKNLAKLSEREIDDAAARIAYRQQTNSGKAGNSVLPDYMAEKVRSKRARDLRIDRAKDLILENEKSAAAALKADAKLGQIITNRGPRKSTGPKVESAAAREKRLSALASERKLVAAQEANQAKPSGLKDIPRTALKMTPEELRAVKPMPSDSTYQKMKDSLDPTKKAFEGSTGKTSEPIRNARGETTEELNARLAKNRAEVKKQQLRDKGGR